MAPFIIGRAFNYWSSSITRVTVPSSSRIGSLTQGMCLYWNHLVDTFEEYVKSGNDKVSVPAAPLVPSTNPRLRSCFQSLVAYLNREVFGFVGWCVETETWVTHWKVIPSDWRSSEIVTAEPVSPSKKEVSLAKGKYVVSIKSSKGKDVAFVKSLKKSKASKNRKTCAGKINTSSPKISKKIRMSVLVDLRGAKPMVLGLRAASTILDVVVPRSPHSSDDGVDISDVMERDDSSHSYDVIGQTDISPLARSSGVAPLVIVGSFPTSGG
ncbi:hypothetical protein FCV25MIE_16358 [Fagus crenata]